MLQIQICLSSSTIVAIVSKWVWIVTSLLSIFLWMNIATPPLVLFVTVRFLIYRVKFLRLVSWEFFKLVSWKQSISRLSSKRTRFISTDLLKNPFMFHWIILVMNKGWLLIYFFYYIFLEFLINFSNNLLVFLRYHTF
jgi:hypothetical protein